MAEKTGTLSLDDLISTRFQRTNAQAFGLDNLAAIAQRDLEAHNRNMDDVVGKFAVRSSDADRLAGTSTRRRMIETDEFGRPPTRKEKPGQTVAFPLRRFQIATGWTRDYFIRASVQEFAQSTLDVMKAHAIDVLTELKKALYLSSNYSFTGELDPITRAVKRLVNADSASIPDGPNGEVFDGATHTHYTAEASLTAPNLLASINSVVEHGHGAQVQTYINVANEAAVKALSGFSPYIDRRLTLAADTNEPLARLDPTRVDNRPIGLFGAAEVWVKPWAIAGYALTCDVSGDAPPLVMREEPDAALQGLQLVLPDIQMHPLNARYWEARFGFGCWNRTNGAVHDFGNASYTDPTIT